MELSDSQIRDYCERMQLIVRRTEAISRLRRTGAGLPWIVVTEIVYLQLRHILELIATALLVVNEDAVAKLKLPGRRDQCRTLRCEIPT